MFGYVVNDAFIKRAAEDLPLFQAVFLRGLVVVALLTLIVRVRNVAVPRALVPRPAVAAADGDGSHWNRCLPDHADEGPHRRVDSGDATAASSGHVCRRPTVAREGQYAHRVVSRC